MIKVMGRTRGVPKARTEDDAMVSDPRIKKLMSLLSYPGKSHAGIHYFIHLLIFNKCTKHYWYWGFSWGESGDPVSVKIAVQFNYRVHGKALQAGKGMASLLLSFGTVLSLPGQKTTHPHFLYISMLALKSKFFF